MGGGGRRRTGAGAQAQGRGPSFPCVCAAFPSSLQIIFGLFGFFIILAIKIMKLNDATKVEQRHAECL